MAGRRDISTEQKVPNHARQVNATENQADEYRDTNRKIDGRQRLRVEPTGKQQPVANRIIVTQGTFSARIHTRTDTAPDLMVDDALWGIGQRERWVGPQDPICLLELEEIVFTHQPDLKQKIP